MEVKFTKGPYEALKHPGRNSGYYIVGPTAEFGKPILASIDWVESDEGTAAQANFFAATWELYEALETLLDEIDRRGYRNDFTKQRAVLAKARGETLPEAA